MTGIGSVVEPVTHLVTAPFRVPIRIALERLFQPAVGDDEADDPGLFGPGSVAWRVHGDASVLVGALRALLVQAMHPEVVAGVIDHSQFKDDPLGRLRRTSDWVTTVTFAPRLRAEAAIDGLATVHRGVEGVSHRGVRYRASDPPLLAWVHNTLVDGFLRAHARYGPGISDADADRYVAEMVRVGERLGAEPLPATAAALRAWVRDHPDVADSPGRRETHRFLASPPLSLEYRVPYAVLHQGALAIVPRSMRALAAPARPLAAEATWLATTALRLVLGPSPRLQEAERRALREGPRT